MKLHKEIRDHLGKIAGVCQLILIALASYPIIILIAIIFIPYRYIVDVILKVKLGDKYGGLLSAEDSFFFRTDKSNLHITSIFVVRSNTERDIFHKLKQILQKKLIDSADYPKFRATIGTFGGYPYIIKDTCNINECVKQLQIPENVTCDEEYFKQLTATVLNKPFPQNNAALWEFLLSAKSLKSTNDGFYRYPLIVRFHHSIGDGTSLMALILRVFGEEETENYCVNLFDKLFCKYQEKVSFLETMVFYLWQVRKVLNDFIFTWIMGIGKLVQNQLKPVEKNCLYGPVLTGEMVVAWTVEDNVKLVPLVKGIKTRLDTKFSSVIMTAISASLTNYFKRNFFPVPPTMVAFTLALLEYPKQEKSRPVLLQNKSTPLSFDLATHSNDSLIETLDKISKSNGDLNVAEAKVNRCFAKYIGILPTNLLNIVAKFTHPTFGMTNVPGGAQLKLLDGCVLEKLIPLMPSGGWMGVTFGILTYDNRFQLGLMVDKALIQSQKEVQKIIDDVFYYITLLGEEALEKNSLN